MISRDKPKEITTNKYRFTRIKKVKSSVVPSGLINEEYYIYGEALRISFDSIKYTSLKGVTSLVKNPTPTGIDCISLRIERKYINEDHKCFKTHYISIDYKGSYAFIRIQWEYLDQSISYTFQIKSLIFKLILMDKFQIPISSFSTLNTSHSTTNDKSIKREILSINLFFEYIFSKIVPSQLELMFSYNFNPFTTVSRYLNSMSLKYYEDTLYSTDYKYSKNNGKYKSLVKAYNKADKNKLNNPSFRIEFVIIDKIQIFKKHLTWKALDNNFDKYLENISKDLSKRLKRNGINLTPLIYSNQTNNKLCTIIEDSVSNILIDINLIIDSLFKIYIEKRGGIIIEMTILYNIIKLYYLSSLLCITKIKPRARSP